MPIHLNIIVAACENGGIGINGQLPWRLRKELQHFSRLTKRVSIAGQQSAVLMGRKTWDSIPEKFRPLPGRINYVMTTRTDATFPGAIACSSLDEAVKDFSGRGTDVDKLWAIGGASVYEMAAASPLLHRVYVTRVMKDINCDTFLPALPQGLTPLSDPDVSGEEQQEGDISYRYEVLGWQDATPSSGSSDH